MELLWSESGPKCCDYIRNEQEQAAISRGGQSGTLKFEMRDLSPLAVSVKFRLNLNFIDTPTFL